MCGFLFEYSNTKLSEETTFLKSLNCLSHRGPDNTDFIEIDNVRMGHTRLSIIDLNKRSNQPLILDNLTIIFNGEIFNYKEIKRDLENEGYTFKTETDTEVILHSYKKWGKDCVTRFNGMWAFVIYDKYKKEIFASRDRFGIKPFFVLRTNNGYIFSSEIEPLTNFGYKLKIDKEYISEFIRQGDPDYQGHTFFSQIKELAPSHNLVIQKYKKINTNRYWDYPRRTTIKTNNKSFSDFENLLSESISLRLRSDVDIALLLSGGVDSSLISEDINKNNPGDLTKGYCYSSGDEKDEFKYAKKIADRSNLKISPVNQISIEQDYLTKLSNLVRRLGKGMASRSIMPISHIYEKIKNDGIKVAIDGQGADELLAGYKHYHLALIPFYIKNFKIKLLFYLIKDLYKEGLIKNFMLFYRSTMPDFMKYIGRLLIGYEKYLRIPYYKKSSSQNFLKCTKFTNKNEDPLNRYLINQHINGLGYLIYYGDIISMIYSIENRSPFLDHRLIEFAFSTNAFFKVQGSVNKYALRKNSLYEPIKDILERKKIGFSTFISEEIKYLMIEELKNSPILNLDIFNYQLKMDLLSNKFIKPKYEYFLFRIFQVHLWFINFKEILDI